MVERRVKPSRRFMAVRTFVTAAAVVDIIAFVAAIAGSRSFKERLVSMTVETGGLFVLADQTEAGNVVIKFDVDPIDRRVTVRARGTQRLPMYIVFFVAGNAFRRCFAMLFVGVMAIAAGGVIVSAQQWKVSALVFE